MNGNPDGYIKYITDEIRLAIGDETDEYKACCLDAKRSMELIESSLDIQHIKEIYGSK